MAHIYHDADETLHYVNDSGDVSSFPPNYNTTKSYELFEEIINNYLTKNIGKNKITKEGFNLLPVIYEDLHWQYCFNYIKYQEPIEKYGLTVKTIDSKEFKVNGYDRVKNIFIGDSWKMFVKIGIKKIIFICWVFMCFFKGKIGKVWVDNFILEDFRYDLLKDREKFPIEEENILRILNRYTSLFSFKRQSINIEEYINNEIHRKTGCYRWWIFAIKVLKPKRIIVKDNLFTLYSILLAAKISRVEIIGISHGSVSFWHRGQFGSKHVSDSNQLKYNKYYVWDNLWQELMLKKNNLYGSDEIRVSGWLKLIDYKPVKKRKSFNFVLYPNTSFTDYNAIKNILFFFDKAGYKIIIKGREDILDYTAYKGIKHQIVAQFTDEHFNNALCAIASSTTMIFDLTATGLPIVIPKDGMNFFKGTHLPNWNYFNKNFNIDSLTKIFPQFLLMPIKTEFIKEFS